MRSRAVRTYRPYYYRRRRYRRFFPKRRYPLYRRYYRPYIRRPNNSALNTVMLRPNWTDNFFPSSDNTRYLLSFNFNGLPELEKFKTLFGYYRFVRMYTRVIPKVTVLQQNTSSGTYVAVPWHRYMTNENLKNVSADDLLDLSHSKSRRCNQVMTLSIVPAVMINNNVIPSGNMKTINFRPWIKIDAEGTNIKHYGILFAFPSDSINIEFLIVTRLYVQLRGYAV